MKIDTVNRKIEPLGALSLGVNSLLIIKRRGHPVVTCVKKKKPRAITYRHWFEFKC